MRGCAGWDRAVPPVLLIRGGGFGLMVSLFAVRVSLSRVSGLMDQGSGLRA